MQAIFYRHPGFSANLPGSHRLTFSSLGLLLLIGSFGWDAEAHGQESLASRPTTRVEAWIKSGKHQSKTVQTLAELKDFKPSSELDLNRFGGLVDLEQTMGAGFFRVRKLGQRWWLIDPEGRRFLHVAVNSVKPGKGPTFRRTFPKHFRDKLDWGKKTIAVLRDHGFNGTGAWSDDEVLASVEPRLTYTRILGFMSSFGRRLGVVSQGSGHNSYEDQLIPVFHPDFPAHCQQVAQRLQPTRDDPFLLGIFSDNELVHNRQALDLHLDFPLGSPERRAAVKWLRSQSVAKSSITDDIRLAYVAHMFDTYFKIVSKAIREVDPNHLYLGSRLHGWDKSNPFLFAAAGKHLDAIAVNVYGIWSPAKNVEKWVDWAGKPVIVTEFYAKGQDSGLPNLSGAGWTVPTQRERGAFYQNFTLDLLQSRGCIGWHYFKYIDNDLLDKRTDPSNRDSNKGILSSSYEPWEPMLAAMKEINLQIYPLAAYFDSQ